MVFTNFVRDLKAQKVRAIVTIVGITWGTFALLFLLGIGESFSDRSKKGFIDVYGEDTGTIYTFQTTKAYKGLGKGRPITLREEDITVLRSRIPEIAFISPIYSLPNVNFQIPGNKPVRVTVTGVYPEWGTMKNIYSQDVGRFINDNDILYKSRVVFLDKELKKDLFGERNAIGNTVNINGIPFLIIGTLHEEISSLIAFSFDESRNSVIPSSTFQSLFGQSRVGNVLFSPHDSKNMDLIINEIYSVLSQKYQFDPEDRGAVRILNFNEIITRMLKYLLTLKVFLSFVAALTLLVGGLGVSNIMNIVVEERKREIGIKLAVGAKRSIILKEFFFESLFLSGIGGIVGFLITSSIFKILSLLKLQDYFGTPKISLSVFVLAMSILSLIAFFAGFFPARKASRLNPVEALR